MMQQIHRVFTAILGLVVLGLQAKAAGRLPQGQQGRETPR
ncbi:heme A synthase [Methylobacterium sp. R2-1]|nr:heme A synthase [Methylobacterium sp. R2-1]